MSFLDELFPETKIDTPEQWAGLNPDTASGLSSALSFASQLGVNPEVTETVRPDNEQPEGGSSNSNHYARNGARAADIAWAGMQWGDPQFNATADHLESQGYSVIRDPHGTGPHIHFESQPTEERNPVDKALFSTAEAAPASNVLGPQEWLAQQQPTSAILGPQEWLAKQSQGISLDQFQSTPLEQQSDKSPSWAGVASGIVPAIVNQVPSAIGNWWDKAKENFQGMIDESPNHNPDAVEAVNGW